MTTPHRRVPTAPKRPTLPIPTEHEEQVAFFRRVALHPRIKGLAIFAIPNGGHRHKAVAAKMKAEGVKAGVPDIFVPVAMREVASVHNPPQPNTLYPAKVFHGLFIEMKRKGNSPTAEQKAWLDLLALRDYRTAVCYSADEAWTTLCNYLGITP